MKLQIEHWVQTPGAAALARTLLHSLWEGAVIALALAIVLAVVKSSRARYAAACIAIIMMLAGLVVTFARLAPAPPARISLAGPRFATPVPLNAGIPAVPDNGRAADELAWLAPLWFAGVLIFYLRGALSWIASRRLRRTGVCCAAAAWQDRLTGLKARLRVTKPVALLESCLTEIPVVVGYLRPMILMPVGLLAGLPATQVEAILLHELAHIRRYDYLVNVMQVFVEGLLFYHPAVWWISGVMRAERENCCDDLVVAVTGGALEYASALTALEKSRAPREVLAATGGSLVNRIQRLLGRPEHRYATAMPVFTAAILTVTVVTAMMALQMGSARPAGVVAKPLAAGARVAPQARAVENVLLAQAQQPRHSEGVAQPDQVLYDRAIQAIAKGQYTAARLTLNTLINAYPGSAYLMKAKLAIANSWAKEGGAHGKAQAEAEYQDFISFYPNTPEAAQARQSLDSIDPYRKWLNQDVAYIISDEERQAFNKLTSDEERAHFVEQFWARRDPTPGTGENEFKTEHYRRIAYTNEHFAAGIAGWRTDRGRIYIQYGPPDEMEVHPAAAGRPASQQWLYHYIDGVGQNVILEFVDSDGNGEYRLNPGTGALDRAQKNRILAPSPADRQPVPSAR